MKTAFPFGQSFRIHLPIFIAGCFLAGGLIAGSALAPSPARDGVSAVAPSVLSVRPLLAPQDAHDEALLPELLQLEIDSANPDLIHLSVLPSVEGQARLVVESDAPVQWMTPRPQGLMTLKRNASTQSYDLNVSAAKSMKAPRLKAELIFEDATGQAYMHVSRELELKGPKAAPVLSMAQPQALSASGRAVLAHTPLDAPVPTTQGGAR